MTDNEPQGGVLTLRGRSISRGIASGKALISQHKISFLGGVDPLTGIIMDRSVDICGECIANRVLIFPGGKGSTVGSYVIYQLKQHGKAPAAMVTRSAGTIVAAGAIIAEIPVVDSLERDPIGGNLITNGMEVLVNGDEGYIEVR